MSRRKGNEGARLFAGYDMSRAVAQHLVDKRPTFWMNDNWRPLAPESAEGSPGLKAVTAAARRFAGFSTLLSQLFPELMACGGVIESPLLRADNLHQSILPGSPGKWFIKADHALAVVGSVKARGGFYEVLMHADMLAEQAGLKAAGQDSSILNSSAARTLFSKHSIAVGSTGNLGMSIGIMAAALGFKATVHMSHDAKAWKKDRLRDYGVSIVEHNGDFSAAVAAGREAALSEDNSYFVDDEKSLLLFLGYSVAALRLREQLSEIGVIPGPTQPVFVYLPCGVGGAPGGITFGLRHIFGDYIHCFFAEPTSCPSMLVRLASSEAGCLGIEEFDLDGRTEADGLAVTRASETAAAQIRTLASGVFTVSDDTLFKNLYRLEQSEGVRVEPSAVAGFEGPQWLLQSENGLEYLARHRLESHLTSAVHILWTTGGNLVPEQEYREFWSRGRRLLFEEYPDNL